MIRSLAVLIPLAAAHPAPQEDAAPERLPPVRHETCLRSFNLKGRLDPGALNEAVHGAGYEIAYGPREAASRPSNSMVVVSVPADEPVRAVERALKKAKVKVEELEVFHFRGRIENGFPTFGIGLKKIDYMLGISGEIKWCDLLEEDTVFYCVKGKLDAEEIEDLWRKLQRPLGTEPATLGGVVTDTLRWTLGAQPDDSAAKKLARALSKLDGVAAVALEGTDLRMELPVAGVVASGPAQGFGGEPPSRDAPPRLTRLTNDVFDLLAEEGLAPVSTAGG